MDTPPVLLVPFRLLRKMLWLLFLCAGLTVAHAAPILKVLFLGDNGHHRPAERLRDLGPTLIARGIQCVYTEDLAALSLENLKRYDALLIYANLEFLPPAQEQALLDYVAQGGGLVALHCASACFKNSDRYVALVGAQFKSHQTGVFRTTLIAPDNPVVKGFAGFESWDETYVHSRHNEQNRTVLEMRENEPWTWTRTEGKGRVFYTAWGHDERTWLNPGFQELVERGIRYAAGQTLPDALSNRPKVAGFELSDQPGIPYYPPSQRSEGDGSWRQMPKPLSPQDSMQHLVVPAGFEVQLVASEPDIQKPIAMTWDERGRLWIAETLDYPNRLMKPGEAGRDRIVLCEDTNGDGKMDKFAVFAEGLNIPTSLTFANGGLIVHQMPNTIFLKDTDGDGKADLKEVLFTGLGRTDTHAGPSNLQYGFDNWIWGVVGYSGFNGSVGGVPSKFKQAYYRFRPDGSALEYIRSNNNNSWGLGFTEEGYVFGSTANNNPSVYVPIASRFYGPAGLTDKVLSGIADTSRFLPLTSRVRQVDVHWGFTAGAGHAIYTARAFPKEYWNRVAFVAEPTGHLVGQFNLEAAGANFHSRNPTNLIVSDDEWFAPIMAEVGPDGAVWVIDWYNYIVQHNPTPKGFKRGEGNAYENGLRDQRYGRIYRIVWKGEQAKPSQPFTLAGAQPAQLVAALGNDNLFWRRQAQRLLVERGRKDVVPALIDLIRDRTVDALGLNVGAIHALRTLEGLHALEAIPEALAAATEALRHPSAGVRRNALEVLPHTQEMVAAVLAAGVLSDADAQVRLSALLVLAQTPAAPGAGEAIHALLSPTDTKLDPWLLDGAKMAATAQKKGFLSACSENEKTAAKASLQSQPNPRTVIEDFEKITGSELGSWQRATGTEAGQATVADHGHMGGRSLQLEASKPTSVVRVARKLTLKANTRYNLTASVRTKDVALTGRAIGAFISIPQIQTPRSATTVAVKGTSQWVEVRALFDSRNHTDVTIECSLGGENGTVSGTAWFDEIVLTELGTTDELVQDPLKLVLAHVLTQGGERGEVAVSETDRNLVTLELGTMVDQMKYTVSELTVKAGQRAKLVFTNNDHMQHNAVVLLPETTDKVGALADALMTDPEAVNRSYVPDSNDVILSTPLVNSGESYSIEFTSPSQPGDYPIICTFPGHWRIMRSVLKVTAN